MSGYDWKCEVCGLIIGPSGYVRVNGHHAAMEALRRERDVATKRAELAEVKLQRAREALRISEGWKHPEDVWGCFRRALSDSDEWGGATVVPDQPIKGHCYHVWKPSAYWGMAITQFACQDCGRVISADKMANTHLANLAEGGDDAKSE